MQKKQIIEIVAGILIIMATVGTISGVFLYEDMLNKEYKTIEFQARSPELGNWDHPEIHLVKGETVRLKIRNTDTVTHGFAIPGMGIGMDEPIKIKAGHVDFIFITPTESGTFLYVCTVWCSTQHPKMVGNIIVSEK